MSTPAYTRNFGQDTSARASVFPEFFIESVEDPIASAREGRLICRDEERVRIIMPGNMLSVPVQRVTDEQRNRWPKEYEAFKNGQETPVEGTPIEQWPILKPAQVKELKFLRIRTVEDLASMADTAVQRMGMGGQGLRAAARAFLDDSERMALETKLMRENELQRGEISSLKSQLEELQRTVNSLHTEIMATRNAPHPLATMIPAAMEAPAIDKRDPPSPSSLDAFAQTKRRPGRPSKAEIAARNSETAA